MSEKIVKICSRKRNANLHNMDTDEFPNFDTGIYAKCNFQRGEIRNRRKCEGRIFPKETLRLATFLKQDDLKEILLDAEAKGIKTHKGRDKKTIQGNIAIHQFSTQIRKKKTRKRLSIHKNVLNAISESELNILWRGRGNFWASGINRGGGGGIFGYTHFREGVQI